MSPNLHRILASVAALVLLLAFAVEPVGAQRAKRPVRKSTKKTPVKEIPSQMPPCTGTFEGQWNTTSGRMAITIDGNRASGTYSYAAGITDAARNGYITGIVSGYVLEGEWTAHNGVRGRLRFVLSSDGRSFTGGLINEVGGMYLAWNGWCLGGQSNRLAATTTPVRSEPYSDSAETAMSGKTVTIVTKNGDRVTGQIIEETPFSVRLRAGGLESTISRDIIASISPEPKLDRSSDVSSWPAEAAPTRASEPAPDRSDRRSTYNDGSTRETIAREESRPSTTTLEMRSAQESVLNDAKRIIAVYCITHRLAILEMRSNMNLAVQVGDQTVTFRADGGKQIRVDARDQEYNINGSSTLTARTRDNGGGVSGITLTYTYIGEGSVRLSEKDAGKTVVLTLKAVNSRVVAMDLSSGAGETEITLNLQR